MSQQSQETVQQGPRRGRIRSALMLTAALAVGALGSGATAYSAHAGEPAPAGNVPSSSPARVTAAAAPLDDPRFAVIQNGTIVRGRNAVSAARLAEGNFEVIFDRDVRGCAFVGSAGNPGGGNPTTGQIAVAHRAGNVNGVYVDTRDSEGFTADRFFHLAVIC